MESEHLRTAINQHILAKFPGLADKIWVDDERMDLEFIKSCGHLSGSQQMLCKLAYSFWHREGLINLNEVVSQLDGENLSNLCAAIKYLQSVS
ncbi:MAG: hypothetical protein AB8G05_16240 [Oligoflexales bacterium]